MVEIAMSYVEECHPIMAKYLARICPKCDDYLGVVVPEPPEPVEEIPIDATCLSCGYKLPLRKIVMGKRTSLAGLLAALIFGFALLTIPWEAWGHRSGCHRWHSCPSDLGQKIRQAISNSLLGKYISWQFLMKFIH